MLIHKPNITDHMKAALLIYEMCILFSLHRPKLGHFNSIGVRGESTLIKTIPVSSGFGYLIIDSVVALHDKLMFQGR